MIIKGKKLNLYFILNVMRYSILILLILFLVFGCKKSKQNKLIGKWELLPQYAADTLKKQIYHFDVGNLLIRTTNDTISDTANYELVQEFNEFYVDIQSLDGYNEGHYYIEKINSKILVLQCYSPYMLKEFVKYE